MPVVIVTGGGVRIGRTVSLFFAKEGWDVALHYHKSREKAEETKYAYPDHIKLFSSDLSDPLSGNSLIHDVMNVYGRIDVVVHNASVFLYDDIHTQTYDMWNRHLSVNTYAPLSMVQALAGYRQTYAQNIIFLLDQRVWNLTPHFLSYTVSKSALWTLTQTLALALAPRIRVNAIGPGPTLPSSFQSQTDFNDQVRRIPLQCSTDPLDIARSIQFIIQTPSLTGQMIALDGGQHLGWAFPETDQSRE
jgi:NAD(P)-dependent dehydrogenase (short-subunit alcohol dehydrogenase family)